LDGWTLHWLEASGDLSGYRAEVTAAFEQAHRTVSAMMPPPHLDIFVQRLADAIIPGMGFPGVAHRSRCLRRRLIRTIRIFAASTMTR
jgi:hypothetical protein